MGYTDKLFGHQDVTNELTIYKSYQYIRDAIAQALQDLTGYLMDKISLYIQSSRTLVSLRYGLCLKLISGELRFKAVVTKLTTVS